MHHTLKMQNLPSAVSHLTRTTRGTKATDVFAKPPPYCPIITAILKFGGSSQGCFQFSHLWLFKGTCIKALILILKFISRFEHERLCTSRRKQIKLSLIFRFPSKFDTNGVGRTRRRGCDRLGGAATPAAGESRTEVSPPHPALHRSIAHPSHRGQLQIVS